MNNILYGILKEEERRLKKILKMSEEKSIYCKLDKETRGQYIEKIKDNLNEVNAAIKGIDEYREKNRL